MNSLPLSWSLPFEESENIGIVEHNNYRWFATPQVYESNFYEKLNFVSKKILIIRGCNREHKNLLIKNGFHFSHFGMEAVLNTSQNHFSKKSLKEIINRGKKHGNIKLIDFTQKNKMKLEEFRKKTVHGNFPQLQNLFQSEFKPNNLLIAFIDQNENWLGAILLSKNSKLKLHTELLLRSVNAPVGIMEALIEHAFNLAKNMGYSQVSLGEVPFIHGRTGFSDFISSFSYYIGKFFSFAYNYKGLYNFKDKFKPKWEEVYICSNRKIGFNHLLFLFNHSQFHNLAMKKFLHKIKSRF